MRPVAGSGGALATTATATAATPASSTTTSAAGTNPPRAASCTSTGTEAILICITNETIAQVHEEDLTIAQVDEEDLTIVVAKNNNGTKLKAHRSQPCPIVITLASHNQMYHTRAYILVIKKNQHA
jgi:hypothetical protein